MPSGIYHAKRIFDGTQWHDTACLWVEGGRVRAILPQDQAPSSPDIPTHRLEHWLVPGLIDLQVNGGGAVLFNNSPDLPAIHTICDAHARFGTTSTMVTLITDTPKITNTAIKAAAAACGKIPGFLGLHLEGPHLALARKGTHDPALIRPINGHDIATIIRARSAIDHLICTLAPEAVSPSQIAELTAAGITVSLGHSDCSEESARQAFNAGAKMVTHLYNAMSQMSHRAPGLVGAALDEGRIWAGMIADGWHVSDTAMRVALRAKATKADTKADTGGIFLVSDAMSTIGSELTEFTLNGRKIYRADGRLTLADGTLAGADIALIDALRYVHLKLGLPLKEALQLASAYPAKAMQLTDRGHLKPGARADFFELTQDITAGQVWIEGKGQGQ